MRSHVLLALWLITDLLIFVAAYALAYFLRVGWILSTDFPFAPYITVVAAVAPLWLLVLATTRTFHLGRNQASLRNGAYIGYAALVGVAIFTLAYYFAYTAFFSRLLLIYALVLTGACIWLWHIAFDALGRRILRRNPPTFPALIIGVTRESKALIATLEERKSAIKPVAILDAIGVKEKEIHSIPVLGKLDRLESTLTELHITHVIQCSDLEQSINLLSACRNRGITYLLLPSVLGIVERDGRIDSLEGYPVAVVAPKQSLIQWFFR
ncbi:MAG: hypothetical protein Q7R81_02020 [Candidatus Peregrinibacteria bacterium]|nr:hypothetical protein [Candidatus Peregrinibacteria bacterium]